MRKTSMLTTAALTGVMLGAAMLAPTAFAQGSTDRGSTDRGSTDRGAQADTVAPLARQQQAARMMDGTSTREVDTLLRQADAAVAGGDWARANEYLERAETTWLNTHAQGGGATSPAGLFSEAGQALKSRDRANARDSIQALMARMEQMGRMPTASMGAGAGAVPMQGGAMGGGGTMMVQPVQQTTPPVQGGLGTPGGASSYGTSAGTESMPNRLQPGTSALGNVEGQPVGPRGAPSPGSPYPTSGGTSSNLSTGGQIQPGGGSGAGSGLSGSGTSNR